MELFFEKNFGNRENADYRLSKAVVPVSLNLGHLVKQFTDPCSNQRFLLFKQYFQKTVS